MATTDIEVCVVPSWDDYYADMPPVDVPDYIAQLQARLNLWRGLAVRGVPDAMIDEILALGADGAETVDQMTALDDATLAGLVECWRVS